MLEGKQKSLFTLLAEINIFVNNKDLDEMASNELSHRDLPCLPLCLSLTGTPVCSSEEVKI